MGRVRDAGNKSFGAVRIGNFAGLVDGETITLARTGEGAFSKVFEWDDDASASPGNISVDPGADAEEAIENLQEAIEAQLGDSLLTCYVDPVDPATLRIEGKVEGDAGNLDFETDMTDPANIIAAVDDKLHGGSKDENRSRASLEYTVTALDVAAQNIMIPTPMQAPKLGAWRAASSTGVPKYITDIVKPNGTRIQIQKNGATNLALGDKVYLEIWSAD